MNMNNIGTVIKNRRGNRTLTEVSQATGISMAMLSLIEQGKRNPSESSLIALAEFFETTSFNLRFEVEHGVSWEAFGARLVTIARGAGPNRIRNQINTLWNNPSLASV